MSSRCSWFQVRRLKSEAASKVGACWLSGVRLGVLFLEFGCPRVVEIGFTTCGVRFARLCDRREAGRRQKCDSGVGERGRRSGSCAI